MSISAVFDLQALLTIDWPLKLQFHARSGLQLRPTALLKGAGLQRM